MIILIIYSFVVAFVAFFVLFRKPFMGKIKKAKSLIIIVAAILIWNHMPYYYNNDKTVSYVTFHAAPNTGGARSSVVTFKTSNGSQESAITATIYQTGSIVDVTCAEFLAQEDGDTEYRITAVIQKVSNTNYGNIYLRDYTNQEVYVYGVGSPGDFTALGLKEGDIVTLVGKRSSYNGNPQMKGAQYVSHYSVTDISIAEFMTKPDDPNPDAPTQYYRLNGVITVIVYIVETSASLLNTVFVKQGIEVLTYQFIDDL